ncbi:glycosyltransferase family 4 protein [Nocardioides lijunqiniae]|uniref:glycosyltransferase family 4 protein n=1 Tax=Nocardioides lijunqiniae TaxID=2760832 RepID=UPI0018777473|nr:glycosyltransferase family 4 protein [Nocardioides lijunqiniae]
MRIGILTQWYDPEPGPAALPAALARGLVARGHSVEVVTGYPNYPDGVLAAGYRVRPRSTEDVDGVRVSRVALYPSHSESMSRRLLNYGSFAASAAVAGVPASFRHVDALWVNYSPVTIGLPFAVQRLLRRTPSVVHVLDLWPDTLAAVGLGSTGGRGRTAVSAVDAVCNWMYRAADRVAYISPGVGDILAERGVPRDKLAYAPMWADETLHKPTPRPDTRGYGLDRDQLAVVYAGTLGRAQGLETLVEACGRMKESRVICLIAGSGTEEGRLRDLAARAGADNVRFLGRLPKEEMPALAAAADVNYVALNDHPLAHVTMPSKLQAILAAGGVVVGSLGGDAAAVVNESGSGWTVAPGDVSGLVDALQEAASLGPEGLAGRRRAAREYYERTFAYDQGVETIEELLTTAAGRRGRA